MQLEVNRSHKKIDTSNLRKPLQRITIGLLSASLSIALYSGALPTYAHAKEPVSVVTTSTETSNEIIDIPASFIYDIYKVLGKNMKDPITKSDLQGLESLDLIEESSDSLEFLKYCSNLKSLFITTRGSFTECLKTLPEMSNLKKIGFVNTSDDDDEIQKEDLAFMTKIPKLKSIMFMGYLVAPGCEERLSNLEELTIISEINIVLDFTKLSNLKKLQLDTYRPYDLAIYLTTEEYKNLLGRGVDVSFDDEADREKYLEISKRLDDIVNSLPVDKNSSDKEKLDAILVYVLQNLSYDKEISNAVKLNMEYTDLAMSFYKGGLLYGALEKDSAICGNYAALVEALCNRLGLSKESCYLENDIHAWNLINIDGQLYFVDSTLLDNLTIYGENGRLSSAEEAIKKGVTGLRWYMEPIDSDHIASIDKSGVHIPTSMPEYMNKITQSAEDLSNNKLPNASQQEVNIKIGHTTIKICMGALVGVLAAIGGAVVIHKKNEKSKIKQHDYLSGEIFLKDDTISSSDTMNRTIIK